MDGLQMVPQVNNAFYYAVDNSINICGKIFRMVLTKSAYESSTLPDSHSLDMYRVNVNHQQFDEFLNTYNITAGDSMHLAPENRTSV